MMKKKTICPECGKVNPPQNRTCQFCQARLVFDTTDGGKVSKRKDVVENENPESSQENKATDKYNQWLDELKSEVDSAGESADEITPKNKPFSWMEDWIYEESDPDKGEMIKGSRIVEALDWDLDDESADIRSQGEKDIKSGRALPGWFVSMKSTGAQSSLSRKHAKGSDEVADSIPPDGIERVFSSLLLPTAKTDFSKTSSGLSLSRSQQAHISLLRQLIDSEKKGVKGSRRIQKSSSRLPILLIAALLTFSILAALLFPILKVDNPSLANFPSVWDAYRSIDNLSSRQMVLVAVDYEPGSSGEMDKLTGVLLKHLFRRNAVLVFVSTNPVGPLQAEKMVTQVSQSTENQYVPFQDYANLGYIPGGHAGLLGFLYEPRETLPFSIDGVDIWQEPAFQRISGITDFSLVVVATENPDTARLWVEQLQPIPSSPSIIMAVSAQIEPVVAPYYLASPQQINGFVHGLIGAAAYESVMVHPDKAVNSFTPFSLAGLMAVVIIILGSLYNSVVSIINKPKNTGQARGAGQ